jgi:hypothetical protein
MDSCLVAPAILQNPATDLTPAFRKKLVYLARLALPLSRGQFIRQPAYPNQTLMHSPHLKCPQLGQHSGTSAGLAILSQWQQCHQPAKLAAAFFF